jgi:peptidoglycan hydrolase CwlO-like protein
LSIENVNQELGTSKSNCTQLKYELDRKSGEYVDVQVALKELLSDVEPKLDFVERLMEMLQWKENEIVESQDNLELFDKELKKVFSSIHRKINIEFYINTQIVIRRQCET